MIEFFNNIYNTIQIMKFYIRKLLNLIIVAPIRYILISIKKNKALRDQTIHSILWNEAVENSAHYVKNFLNEVMLFDDKQALWDLTIKKIEALRDCVILEFGCYKGTSINYFATRLPNNKFYGFDSFKGLSSNWYGHHSPVGTFDLKSTLPKVTKNVDLITGWFDKSLPVFFKNNTNLDVLFMHIDCDTYDSTCTVLMNTKNLLKPGVLILFDDYLAYPNWENGEFLAWKEFCHQYSIKYRYIAFATEQALIEII